MKIVLPLPPSDNRRFLIVNHSRHARLALSNEHRTYKNIIVPFAMLKYKKEITIYKPTFEKQLFIAYQVFLPDKRRDGSNCEKVLKDSLKGILYDDDKWVNLLAVKVEIDKDNPRIELTVLEEKNI